MAKVRHNRQLILSAVVAAVLVLLVLQGGLLEGVVPGRVDTTFHSDDASGWAGGGAANGQASREPTARFIQFPDYIASYDPSLGGQTVTFQGALVITNQWSNCKVNDARYKLFLDIGVGDPLLVFESGRLIQSSTAVSGWVNLPSQYWDVRYPDGKTVIPEGSVISAEFHIHEVPAVPTWPGCAEGWFIVGRQKSVIHTGIGTLNPQGDSPHGVGQAVVGGQACWDWQVGYILTGHGLTGGNQTYGWNYYVVSYAQSLRTVLGPTKITDYNGRFCYTVTTQDFVYGGPPGTNKLIAYLRNELFSKDFSSETTISEAALAEAPTCTLGGITPQSPKQGDRVTVNFECTPAGSNASMAIESIELLYGWGSLDHDETLPAGTTSYSFTATQAGFVRVEVIAYTVNGVPSATVYERIAIEHQLPVGCGVGTDNSTCTRGGSLSLLFVVLLVIGIIMALIGYFVEFAIPDWLRYVLMIVGILLVVLSLYFLITAALAGG